MDSIYKILLPLFDEYKIDISTHYEINIMDLNLRYKGNLVYDIYQWKDSHRDVIIIYGGARDSKNLMDIDIEDFESHSLMQFIFELRK